MTEKRFKTEDYFEVWDNDEFLLSFDEAVDLLNQLNDENKKLKNKLKFFYELNKPYGDIIKENEQLKQENKMMKGVIYDMDDEVYCELFGEDD